MTGDERELSARLAQLADYAPPPRGRVTADRAAALDRRVRRRGRIRVAAGGLLAVLLLLTGVGVGTRHAGGPRPATSASPGPPAPRDGGSPRPSLYDAPTRGSLAGDPDFLAGVRALPWPSPPSLDGPPGDPAAEDRRVLYAGDVPGSRRWALVAAPIGVDLGYAWFTGPGGADADELTLALPPARGDVDRPIALLDASAPTGPLVVVVLPGDTVEYSPSLDRAADGSLQRTYSRLSVVDGVVLAGVVTPPARGGALLRVTRDGHPITSGEVPEVGRGGAPPFPPDVADPRYWERLRDCLVPLGFLVQLDPAGQGLSWSGGPALVPDQGPPSTAEDAQNQAAFEGCVAQVGAG
jgi:hypothetical protein